MHVNATFLRGEKIVRDIFSIEWSFGVGWAQAGEFDKVSISREICRIVALGLVFFNDALFVTDCSQLEEGARAGRENSAFDK